ncbi:MAG: DUF3822 family protein [Bacteroidia bacterium]
MFSSKLAPKILNPMSHPVPFVKYADPAFTAERTRHCELRCLISESELVLTVYDILSGQFRLIERYPLTNSYNKNRPAEVLARILQTHALTRLEFKHIEIIPDTNSWLLVPVELFDESAISPMLALGNEPEPNSAYGYDRLSDGKRFIIRAWPESWKQVIDAQFPDYLIRHSSSILFEILMRRKMEGSFVYVNVHGFMADILVINGSNPHLFNSYAFQSPEDFIYFIGLAYEKLELNRDKDPLILMGEIEEGSALHQISFRYFRDIRFFERPGEASVPDAPEGFPALGQHAYVSLLHPYDSDN